MSIEALRRAYLRVAATRSEGRDPQVERREHRLRLIQETEKARLARTVSVLGWQFIEEHSKRRKKAQSAREDQRILEKEIIPVIGKLPVDGVQRRQLVELVENVTRRGSPVMANRVRAFLSKLFNWAVERCILDTSPANRLPANKETERTRVLTDAELKSFWLTIDVLTNPVHQAAVRVLLLTGQRRSEVARMSYEELDGKWWTIPAARAKNGVAHRVPLSTTCYMYLGRKVSWVFPSQTANHLHPDTLSDLVYEVVGLASIAHCTAHDLRRTAGTFIQKEFGSEVMHKVLNHTEDKLTRVYGQYDFDKEKRIALESWARHLETLYSGQQSADVINFEKRRA
jgi:integrase